MGWFITACITGGIALIIGLIALAVRPNGDAEMQDAKRFGGFATLGLVVLAGVFMLFGSFYTQSVGQGVIVTRIGGSVVTADTTPGLGTKAPWDTAHKWDLFTRDISLAGDREAEFENGEINASQIATSVKSGEESGAQVWYDLDATYNIDNADLKALYSEYRDQDRFTRQVVYPAIQKAARSIPSSYTTTEFRGAGSVTAGDEIAAEINERLASYGVEITVATVKSVNFTEAVEASLSVVEEKQQQEEAARADAAAKQVQNEQMIKNAKAEAESNTILSKSITPELVELRKIEAYKEGTVFVVPSDSTPLISTAK
jgi:regulator of protease activity HflC (stomatin/prohibitin superfamily)